jgi:hypothetical protein
MIKRELNLGIFGRREKLHKNNKVTLTISDLEFNFYGTKIYKIVESINEKSSDGSKNP